MSPISRPTNTAYRFLSCLDFVEAWSPQPEAWTILRKRPSRALRDRLSSVSRRGASLDATVSNTLNRARSHADIATTTDDVTRGRRSAAAQSPSRRVGGVKHQHAMARRLESRPSMCLPFDVSGHPPDASTTQSGAPLHRDRRNRAAAGGRRASSSGRDRTRARRTTCASGSPHSHVELDHLRSFSGEHQAGVENPRNRAPGLHCRDPGMTILAMPAPSSSCVSAGSGKRSHAARFVPGPRHSRAFAPRTGELIAPRRRQAQSQLGPSGVSTPGCGRRRRIAITISASTAARASSALRDDHNLPPASRRPERDRASKLVYRRVRSLVGSARHIVRSAPASASDVSQRLLVSSRPPPVGQRLEPSDWKIHSPAERRFRPYDCRSTLRHGQVEQPGVRRQSRTRRHRRIPAFPGAHRTSRHERSEPSFHTRASRPRPPRRHLMPTFKSRERRSIASDTPIHDFARATHLQYSFFFQAIILMLLHFWGIHFSRGGGQQLG